MSKHAEKSRTQQSLEVIYQHPRGIRTDEIAQKIAVDRKQVHSIVAPLIAAGLVISSKIERPGQKDIFEFRISASAPDIPPDYLAWKRDHPITPSEVVNPCRKPNTTTAGPRAAAAAQKIAREGATRPQPPEGINISGSRASESPVGAATASTEGAAGDDARAGSHGPESAVAAADEPAASPVLDRVIARTFEPKETKLSIDGNGQLSIGQITFNAAETTRIGLFMAGTEPIWSQS